jgi:hypothetical protein
MVLVMVVGRIGWGVRLRGGGRRLRVARDARPPQTAIPRPPTPNHPPSTPHITPDSPPTFFRSIPRVRFILREWIFRMSTRDDSVGWGNSICGVGVLRSACGVLVGG